MAKHCTSCGTAAADDIRFCGKCGAAFAGESSPVGGPPAPPPVPSGGSPALSAPGLESNVAGFLCYVLGFITGVLFLVLEPYNKDRFVRFHAWQSIASSVVLFVINIVLTMMWRVMPWGLYSLLWSVYGLGVLVLWFFLMYKAYNKEKFKLPLVGDFAEKQAGA